MTVKVCVGIDLGTTKSTAAILGGSGKHIIFGSDGKGGKSIPSAVWKNGKTGEVLVGRDALKKRSVISVVPPVVSVKKVMSTASRSVLGRDWILPETAASYILRECIRLMQERLNALNDGSSYVVDRAVITVPAYFSVNAMEATKRAGEEAGVKVEKLLAEPAAALLSYAWKHRIKDGVYLVYDLGGGTFDVSIIRLTDGIMDVCAVAGDYTLGGETFDSLLADKTLKRKARPPIRPITPGRSIRTAGSLRYSKWT